MNGLEKEEIKLPFIEILKAGLYPNPTRDELNLDIELNQEAEITFSIYSLEGKFIDSKVLTIHDNEVEFDVRELLPGMYILKMYVNESERIMRFIKI